MDKDLFNELIESCKEAIEYQKGNLQLKTTVMEIPDNELDMEQLLYNKASKLSAPDKQRLIMYADELLQASGS